MYLSRLSDADFVSAGPTSRWRGEPTLNELLSEPIVTAVMEADGVDRNELEAMLRRLAVMLRSQDHRASTRRDAWASVRTLDGR